MLFLAAAVSAAGQQVPDAEQFVGAPKGTPIAGDQLYRRTAEIAALLRCPVCQGLSVADSPSEMAVNMKRQVRELLARGYTQEQILQYFERSYGQFVLLKPKFEGVNALVWLIPIGALVIGVLIVFAKIRKLERGPDAPVEDEEYVARVRNIVNGEKS